MESKQYILSPKEAKAWEGRYRIQKRSVDARQRELKVLLTVLVDENGQPVDKDAPIPLYEKPRWNDAQSANDNENENENDKGRGKKVVHIVGAGPAGLFAALTLLEHGIKPIIYERGKEVSARKVDIAQLNRNNGLNEESNYCFGEGGAGTFSDGKLFSRSKKRGNMQRVMELFHYFGANDGVLYEAHAHIGSDKLPGVIKNMRECILAHGGEIRFGTRIDSLEPFGDEPVILAIGHSAHDTYKMLAREGVKLENKGFAMGVRCEHPQELINRLMYGHRHPLSPSKKGGTKSRRELSDEYDYDPKVVEYVGNASYSLVTQVDGRGVYSFCMCPGGHIVPAGSEKGSCVVNGMSASHRNSPYANSGIVVEIRTEDIVKEEGRRKKEEGLEGLAMQEELERLAYEHGGPEAQAPAQRLRDFVEGRLSKDLPKSSYLPGMVSSRLDEWLPAHIGKRLQQGFRDFDRKFPGFLTNEAVILGVESRSSSAVRIPRDPETMLAQIAPDSVLGKSHCRLYPCGEGAGYAGGITSSALDGINAAMAVVGDW